MRFHKINFLILKKIFLKFFSVNGILITLLLGILINASSDRISEIIARQRYLELLQFEITNIALQSTREIQSYADNQGVLVNYKQYPEQIYLSGLENGYILTLSPTEIATITTFYDIKVRLLNEMGDRIESQRTVYLDEWEQCILRHTIESSSSEEGCINEEKLKHNAEVIYSKQRVEIAKDLGNDAFKILDEFHPTRDRLNSPILKFLLGSETIEVLK